MSILCFLLLFLGGEIPVSLFRFAMLCDTVLVAIGLFLYVLLHHLAC